MAKQCMVATVVLVVAVMAVIMSSGEHAAAAQDCNPVDFLDVVTQCEQYVEKSRPTAAPSPECCAAVNEIQSMQCICRFVSSAIEDIISMDKVVFVARSCGKTVAAGTQCGSYTVPTILK